MSPVKQGAPYAVGDTVRLLHSDAAGATVLGNLPVTRVVRVADSNGPQWRITMPRTGGGDCPNVEVVVGSDGRDVHGYAEPCPR